MSGLDSDTWALSEFDLLIVNGDAMTFSTDPGEKLAKSKWGRLNTTGPGLNQGMYASDIVILPITGT